MTEHAPLRLPAVELAETWSALDLGEPPVALRLPYAATPGPRQVDPRVADLARRLADAAVTLDLHVHGGVSAVGAVGRAVVALAVDGDVELRTASGTSLVDALLAEVEPLPAGPGTPANLTETDYRRACDRGVHDGPDAFLDVLRAAGLREQEAATVALAVLERHGGGQLGVTTRGRRGDPMRWLDTPAGRYTLGRRDEWITVTPADPRRLASMAKRLFENTEATSWVLDTTSHRPR